MNTRDKPQSGKFFASIQSKEGNACCERDYEVEVIDLSSIRQMPSDLHLEMKELQKAAGGPFITTNYDYNAPIDEYGLLRQTEYDHIKALHRDINSVSDAIISVDHAFNFLGTYERTHVVTSIRLSGATLCWRK